MRRLPADQTMWPIDDGTVKWSVPESVKRLHWMRTGTSPPCATDLRIAGRAGANTSRARAVGPRGLVSGGLTLN